MGLILPYSPPAPSLGSRHGLGFLCPPGCRILTHDSPISVTGEIEEGTWSCGCRGSLHPQPSALGCWAVGPLSQGTGLAPGVSQGWALGHRSSELGLWGCWQHGHALFCPIRGCRGRMGPLQCQGVLGELSSTAPAPAAAPSCGFLLPAALVGEGVNSPVNSPCPGATCSHVGRGTCLWWGLGPSSRSFLGTPALGACVCWAPVAPSLPVSPCGCEPRVPPGTALGGSAQGTSVWRPPE